MRVRAHLTSERFVAHDGERAATRCVDSSGRRVSYGEGIETIVLRVRVTTFHSMNVVIDSIIAG